MRYIKYSLLLLTLFMAFIATGCSKLESNTYGDGSEENPYLIYNEAQFLDFGGKVFQNENRDNFKNVHYKLMNNLDFKGLHYNPIGVAKSNSFDGVFDGNNHTIKNISINNNEGLYLGVFGYVGEAAIIKNLNVENIEIIDEKEKYFSNVGGIVGYAGDYSKIINCKVVGKINLHYQDTIKLSNNYLQNVKSAAGGIVGFSMGYIYDCYSSVSIKADCSGGIVGLFGGFITNNNRCENCHLFGSIVCGGVVGSFQNYVFMYPRVEYSRVENCNLESNYSSGGLIGGFLGYFEVVNAYIDANIVINQKGYVYAGGVVGIYYSNNSYIPGQLTGQYLKKVIANVNLKVNNISNDKKYLQIGYFGTKKKSSLANELLRIIDGVFNGSIKLENKVEIDKEILQCTNCGIVLNDNNNVTINETLIIDNDVKNVAKVLGVHSSWIKYSEGKYDFSVSDYENIFSYLDGEGTEDNPYLIKTIEDFTLAFLSYDRIRYFRVENDIDASGYSSIEHVYFLNYSGERISKFKIDGNNKTINNLTIRNSYYYKSSIFSESIKNSLIKDLTFNNLKLDYEISLNDYYVVLFGSCVNSLINNVTVNIVVEEKAASNGAYSIKLFKSSSNTVVDGLKLTINDSGAKESLYLEMFNSGGENMQMKNSKITINYSNDGEKKVKLVLNKPFELDNNEIRVTTNNSFEVEYPENDINENELKIYLNDSVYN